jgi:predicted enzyme related to lactoylglutathione lyase
MAMRPMRFEIPVDDPDLAEMSNSNVFGCRSTASRARRSTTAWLRQGEGQPSIDGALLPPGGSHSCTVLTMSVDSIEDAAERVTPNGGKVTQEKGPVPGMGWFALC